MLMNRKPKVALIGTVGLPARYGGFETLANHLVENLSDTYDFTVYCTSKKYPKGQRPDSYKGARLVYLPLDANGIQSIPYDTLSILHALFFADVLLILGVAGACILPFVRLFTRKKILISIDGIEWKRDKWSLPARWYLWWAESLAVKYSHVDISDNESIQDYTAVRYGSLSRIVEYGADHTMKVSVKPEDKERFSFLTMPYAMKVCRIEPENNVHVVLEAFSRLPRHVLVLIGNWNNSEYGKALRRQYKGFPNLHLLDPIYEQRTLDLIRGNALVYVHGHSAGGTNPSLVEAMYLGLPVLAFGVSYNRTTTEHKALYFKNADELYDLVLKTQVSDLKQMATEMEAIAHRRYTWKGIAHRYHFLLQETLQTVKKVPVRPIMSQFNTQNLSQLELAHFTHPRFFFEK